MRVGTLLSRPTQSTSGKPIKGGNMPKTTRSDRRRLAAGASAMALAMGVGIGLAGWASPAAAGMDEARRWVECKFQPSTLSKDDQLKEMEWFVNAAKQFQGKEAKVVSETLD